MCNILNKAQKENRRIISVGTTTTRTLESVMTKYNKFVPVHEETNKDVYLFNEKIRLDMKWKANAFIIIDDTIYFGGLSNQILCANGLFRF